MYGNTYERDRFPSMSELEAGEINEEIDDFLPGSPLRPTKNVRKGYNRVPPKPVKSRNNNMPIDIPVVTGQQLEVDMDASLNNFSRYEMGGHWRTKQGTGKRERRRSIKRNHSATRRRSGSQRPSRTGSANLSLRHPSEDFSTNGGENALDMMSGLGKYNFESPTMSPQRRTSNAMPAFMNTSGTGRRDPHDSSSTSAPPPSVPEPPSKNVYKRSQAAREAVKKEKVDNSKKSAREEEIQRYLDSIAEKERRRREQQIQQSKPEHSSPARLSTISAPTNASTEVPDSGTTSRIPSHVAAPKVAAAPATHSTPKIPNTITVSLASDSSSPQRRTTSVRNTNIAATPTPSASSASRIAVSIPVPPAYSRPTAQSNQTASQATEVSSAKQKERVPDAPVKPLDQSPEQPATIAIPAAPDSTAIRRQKRRTSISRRAREIRSSLAMVMTTTDPKLVSIPVSRPTSTSNMYNRSGAVSPTGSDVDRMEHFQAKHGKRSSREYGDDDVDDDEPHSTMDEYGFGGSVIFSHRRLRATFDSAADQRRVKREASARIRQNTRSRGNSQIRQRSAGGRPPGPTMHLGDVTDVGMDEYRMDFPSARESMEPIGTRAAVIRNDKNENVYDEDRVVVEETTFISQTATGASKTPNAAARVVTEMTSTTTKTTTTTTTTMTRMTTSNVDAVDAHVPQITPKAGSDWSGSTNAISTDGGGPASKYAAIHNSAIPDEYTVKRSSSRDNVLPTAPVKGSAHATTTPKDIDAEPFSNPEEQFTVQTEDQARYNRLLNRNANPVFYEAQNNTHVDNTGMMYGAHGSAWSSGSGDATSFNGCVVSTRKLTAAQRKHESETGARGNARGRNSNASGGARGEGVPVPPHNVVRKKRNSNSHSFPSLLSTNSTSEDAKDPVKQQQRRERLKNERDRLLGLLNLGDSHNMNGSKSSSTIDQSVASPGSVPSGQLSRDSSRTDVVWAEPPMKVRQSLSEQSNASVRASTCVITRPPKKSIPESNPKSSSEILHRRTNNASPTVHSEGNTGKDQRRESERDVKDRNSLPSRLPSITQPESTTVAHRLSGKQDLIDNGSIDNDVMDSKERRHRVGQKKVRRVRKYPTDSPESDYP